MNVPRFETQADLKNEEMVVKRFAAKGNYQYKKLERNGLDYALVKNGKAVCFVEIKCFNVPHNKFSQILNSLYKWEKMQEYERLLPVFFVCHFSDGEILYIRAKKINGDIKWAGRKPREGAKHDQEFCVFIPTKDMKLL